MTLARLSPVQPVTAPSGRPTTYLLGWVSDLVAAFNLLSARTDSAVPTTRTVAAAGGLQGGGALAADVGLALYRVVVPVARLPLGGNAPGDWAYAVDGCKPGEAAGSGTGVPVFWSHSAWFSACGGVPVTA